MIADLEDKFELNKTNLDAEGKYKAIVLMFGEAVEENLKYDLDNLIRPLRICEKWREIILKVQSRSEEPRGADGEADRDADRTAEVGHGAKVSDHAD